MSMAQATADVLKVALKSTAATVRLIVIAVAFTILLAAFLWLARDQGLIPEQCGFSGRAFSCTTVSESGLGAKTDT